MIHRAALRIEFYPAGMKTTRRIVAIADVVVGSHQRQIRDAVACVNRQQRIEAAPRRVELCNTSEQRRLPGQPDGVRAWLAGVIRFARLLCCVHIAATTCSVRVSDAVLTAHGVGERQIAQLGRPDLGYVAVDGSGDIRNGDTIVAGVGGLERCDRECGTVRAGNIHAVAPPLIGQRR